jgi:hypothetical protein
MVRFLGGILAITVAVGQPLPNLGYGSAASGFNWAGPKNLYPGYAHHFSFPGIYWRVPVTCSATGNTCDTAGSGYTPTGTEIGVFVTATTPPTGMETMIAGVSANYKICNVSGTQFQLGRSNACTTIEAFSSTGTNVSIVLTNAAIGNGAHTFITSNTGWPSGTTLQWGYSTFGRGWNIDAVNSPNHNPEDLQHNSAMVLRATIPTGATPGNYSVSIVMCTTDTTGGGCAGLSDTLSFTVTVAPLTYLSDANEPTSFPAITGLSTWVSFMTNGTNGGGKWCTKSTGVTNPANLVTSAGTDNTISFYDGGLAYRWIAQWTGDSAWLNCANNILQQMAWGNANSAGGGYIIPNNGGTPGYRLFPTGYMMASLQDARYADVVQYYAGLMDRSGGGAFVGSCNASDLLTREDSYGLEVMLAIDRLGLTPRDPTGTAYFNVWRFREQSCANMLIQVMDYYTNGEFRYAQDQYFITGLALDVLIKWWQVTKDPRVPMVVKPILDQYWTNYNLTTHKAMWTPDPAWPASPRCSSTTTWFNATVSGHCQDTTSDNVSDLHNLFVHAFAWYWRVSGDDAYRTEGDEIFSHEFDNPAFNFLGKTFSQAYRYSFNYVGWRQGWLSPEKSIE